MRQFVARSAAAPISAARKMLVECAAAGCNTIVFGSGYCITCDRNVPAVSERLTPRVTAPSDLTNERAMERQR